MLLDFYIDLNWGIEFARLMAGSIPVYPIEVKVVKLTLIAYAELRWIVVLSRSCER